MEWVSVKNQSLGMQEYHLLDAGSKRAILKYNTHQQVARIQCDGNYGIFFIERTGSFVNRTLFKNEYGQEIGRLSFDIRHSHTGPIELNGKKFQYSFQNNPFAELVIFNKDVTKPLISSRLKNADDQTSVVFTSVNNEEYACLLLGLCWYVLNPALAKQSVQPVFANAGS
ncbi:MAG TPA: hypothetical protein VK543_03755 [Puia sp.]|nr:hypothetical protein [Puia sp.]